MRRRARLSRFRLTTWRPSLAWLRAVVRSFVTSFLALTASLQLLPGTQVTRGAESVAYLAVGVLFTGALLRPLITRLTVLTGAVGLLLTGVLAQAVILGVALAVVPTVDPFSWTEVVVASWAAAVVAASVNWLFDANSDEAFLDQVLGRAVRRTPEVGVEGPGLLVVQLDGVSEPLLRQAIISGAMPTLSRWVRSGSHDLRGWHTGVPATTPAGQAVLLHGDVTAVPGFRWYDKDKARLLAVSRPSDAAEVEAEMSTGRGLLADGGMSVSNIFSGDAPSWQLTVSHARSPGGDSGVASYAALRFGFLRAIALFVGQMVTEWHQGRRQRIRDVVPRVRRGGTFVVLRGLTTVILRDLNVAIVAEQMTRGTPVVFVDFVDYDEVAHHAGPTRPESLRTLENLDRVLAFFEELAAEVGRSYEIAVVSDHGQAQGSTFLQLTGHTLETVVRQHALHPSAALGLPAGSSSVPRPPDTHADETWVPANLLLAGSRGTGRAVARAASTLARSSGSSVTTGTGVVDTTPGQPGGTLLVAVSGSLAHVYRTDWPGRLTRDQLDELHPLLVQGLASHPEIGVVMTRRDDGTLLVDGLDGWRAIGRGPAGPLLLDGEGTDPLEVYGPRAAADLLGLEARQHVGDLVLFGRSDPALGEVVAFEELVGSHGGLGGWQTDALLVHPHGWAVPTSPLDGPAVHAAMVGRLETLGLRRET